ncbi:hypothetical protein CQW23_07783 [Capsicum baccatum]|uniref:Ubiquitin-like protease family profile domain-containing protein n=1 Tax=Capsicum baccatum TaxID=33114 RepID=A0A2G2X7L2_CAPBA|nr:hypothetical protein CQW23_07783 [Capsicum baccatum]
MEDSGMDFVDLGINFVDLQMGSGDLGMDSEMGFMGLEMDFVDGVLGRDLEWSPVSSWSGSINSYGQHPKIRSFLDAYKEKTDQHAFDVYIVDGIVQQSNGTLDYGLFVVAYAEFLSDRHQIPSSEFDPKRHRTRFTSLLWDYGVNKACTG